MKVSGKTIVVTGAAGGVGKELVLQLLANGAKVAAVDISEERLTAIAKEVNSKSLSTHVCDLSKLEAVEGLFTEIIKIHKTVDGVINNAGIIQPFIKVNELSFKQIEFVMNVNFYGTLYMVKTFLPHLLERPEAHILNVSSMGGFFPVPGQAIYGASKAAIKLMTEALYAELMPTNVNVTLVLPGALETDIAKNSNVDMGTLSSEDAPKMKMTTAKAAAEIIIKSMEKNKFQVFLGKDSKMMNLIYKLNPKAAPKIMYKALKDQLE
ncbi:MAG: SDR family NAD(P)-dependent oxidoreductase [Bacilli bacterium]|nr:SDR family NAD(P)-dependent oxidoreductase [Bacilli bacterium]MBN2876504.1 SDR family NAD(P)-dependent oxidoreductase [Bacilli bacterium]